LDDTVHYDPFFFTTDRSQIPMQDVVDRNEGCTLRRQMEIMEITAGVAVSRLSSANLCVCLVIDDEVAETMPLRQGSFPPSQNPLPLIVLDLGVGRR
jgi:hypothetical protein